MPHPSVRQDPGEIVSAVGLNPSSEPLDSQGPRCLVVMYHYVHDGDPLDEAGGSNGRQGVRGLTEAGFRAQLDRLCDLLEPTDWPSLYAWRHGRGTIPPRSFLLTFDDGLADHARTVLPILKDRGLRGVFFVPGAILTTHRMLSAHAIHLLLSRLSERELIAEFRQYLLQQSAEGQWLAKLDAVMGEPDGRSDPAAQAMYDYETPIRARLKHWLTMTLPIELRVSAVHTLFERHVGSSARWARHWYLGWDDLVELQFCGHTIGGHGFIHEPYSRLTAAQCRQDVLRVSTVLSQGLGTDLRPFSFPYGSLGGDLESNLRDAGFPHSFSTESRWLGTGDDLYGLPRVDTIHVEAALNEEMACSRA
ncbi:MAG: polysaccharide deacetylase family protein [Planctomycetes bacterium]|nr:polysaccharide deacetylase family protein [Planctomycetota bacterium]